MTMGMGDALGPLASKAFPGISSPVLRGAITQGIVGTGVGAVGGGIGAEMNGGNFWQGAGQGAIWGAGIGFATGAYGGCQNARAYGFDPWTGKSIRKDIKLISINDNRTIRTEPSDLSE